MEVQKMFDNLGVAAVASDTEYNIIYINEAGKKAFEELLGVKKVLGTNMIGCHKPETMGKLKEIFQSFREKKSRLHYYVMDIPGGKATVVSVPFFNEGEFAGVIEFIFEGTLG